MKFRLVLRVLAFISLVVSICMVFPMIWSAIDAGADFGAFVLSLLCGVGVSFALFTLGGGKIGEIFFERRKEYEELGIREAFAVVGLSWVIAAAVGALPYVLAGCLPSYTDAFFETVSGFTTTGATVITDVEAVPRGLLFWRGMTHWLGGMGIIVLSLAVLPFLGVGGMELYKAEVPGPTPEKLTPRVQQTALCLWGVYVFLTALETAFLMFGGMDLFESLIHAFSTISTGGFSTRNASVAAYGSAYIEWVITFFMVASGVNFALHFLFLTGFCGKALRDEEFRFYAGICLFSTAVVAAMLWGGAYLSGLEHAVRGAAFQVASFITTTGFVSENYNLWPRFARSILMLLAFVGGCAGSTGGGLKVVRVLLLLRCIGLEIQMLLHPRSVPHTRVNGTVVSSRALSAVLAFFTLYVAILVVATLAALATGQGKLDMVTAVFGAVVTLSNVGPGLGHLGAVENYAWLPDAVKWIFSLCMLAGRLELYPILLLLYPPTWTR
ncbi:MAG: TrkH family potassium uptake protein [Synergistaceae bacterium]|jgi:trk system potassium uptake protein TrkH|nr:TrkH family potassium uptake protein [Synergistaceae bacterium]